MENRFWTVTYRNRDNDQRITAAVFAADQRQAQEKAQADGQIDDREVWEIESVEPHEETLARILVAEFSKKQQGGHFACPRCGKMAMDAESVTRNALSRRATVHICDACGTVMEQIGKEVQRTLVLRPATATIREDVYYTYACRKCSIEATETPILKTERIPPVISGSYASPEAIAHIMVQKFVMASPLYRQEQELNRSGIQLSRQTMSNWILRAADDWLTPIYEEMKKRLVKEQILHADETTLQVLKEPGQVRTIQELHVALPNREIRFAADDPL